jgi:hypothetical protein
MLAPVVGREKVRILLQRHELTFPGIRRIEDVLARPGPAKNSPLSDLRPEGKAWKVE